MSLSTCPDKNEILAMSDAITLGTLPAHLKAFVRQIDQTCERFTERGNMDADPGVALIEAAAYLLAEVVEGGAHISDVMEALEGVLLGAAH